MSELPVAAVLEQVDADLDGSLSRLFELMAIPSVSTDPAYKEHVERAADWCVAELTGLGFTGGKRQTPGHPMIVAHHPGPNTGGVKRAPHILYYGHYDVQPPEPLELWDAPPFEPQLIDAERGKRIVGRGAVDDKGQVMTWMEAIRAWHVVQGAPPCEITVLLEGEEETGSPSLEPFLEANREELARADVAIVCDTPMWSLEKPAITWLLRGMCYVEISLEGPSHDLHSGLYGGAVLNPINGLTQILGDLHDDQGRVQIPGFYDDVEEPPESVKANWAALGFDEPAFLAGVGLTVPHGEAGRTPLERLWSRPTADVNGIWGGYTGEGSKTVIAAKASCKLSCRLVPRQDPAKIAAGVEAFFRARAPEDGKLTFRFFGRSPGLKVATDTAFFKAAEQGLQDVFGVEPALMGCGGSIPVVGSMQRILDLDSLLVGFGLEDDRVHSPNEKFEQACLHQGIRSNAAILGRLAQL
jgi:acetylornithine deacetylase/succinyl-diaminopimelate desuccinylase-like protein